MRPKRVFAALASVMGWPRPSSTTATDAGRARERTVVKSFGNSLCYGVPRQRSAYEERIRTADAWGVERSFSCLILLNLAGSI